MDKKVVEYIEKLEPQQKETLLGVRKLISSLLPEAEERMSYGAPSFRLRGKSIIYAAFKKHIGFYPEPEWIEKFKAKLESYETSKGAVKFYLDKPIPWDLIEKIVRAKFEL